MLPAFPEELRLAHPSDRGGEVRVFPFPALRTPLCSHPLCLLFIKWSLLVSPGSGPLQGTGGGNAGGVFPGLLPVVSSVSERSERPVHDAPRGGCAGVRVSGSPKPEHVPDGGVQTRKRHRSLCRRREPHTGPAPTRGEGLLGTPSSLGPAAVHSVL